MKAFVQYMKDSLSVYDPAMGNLYHKKAVFHEYSRFKLSQINFPDYPYMECSNWYFYLDTLPEQAGTYTFRIQVTFADGRSVETTTTPVSIAGR
jgi:hypothetical protein